MESTLRIFGGLSTDKNGNGSHDGRGRVGFEAEMGGYQMSKKKFVRGSYTLAANITDPDAYYQEHKAAIDGVIKWAYQVGMYVGFGTSKDNTYLCEYDTTQFTKSMCTGLANELKARLKAPCKFEPKEALKDGKGD